MSHQPLTDSELAESGLDLTSWVLQDDLYQQDFCYGAKGTHSPSAVGLPEFTEAGISTSLLDTDDFKLEDYFPESLKNDLPIEERLAIPTETPMLIDDHLDLQDIMKEEILQQQKQQQLIYFKQQEQEELLRKQREQECIRKQKELELIKYLQEKEEQQKKQQMEQELLQKQNIFLEQSLKFNTHTEADSMEILYDNSSVCSESICVSAVSSPSYLSSPIQCLGSDEMQVHDSGPRIISVPLAEALSQPSTFVTNQYQPTYESPSVEITDAHFLDEKPEPTKPFVINVKRVSLPKRISSKKPSVKKPALTLKQALESREADDFINELISSPPPESVQSIDDGENFTDCIETQSRTSAMSPENVYSDFPESPLVKGSRKSPYSVTEKKLRKKEQNKRAALRYRQKKKEEEDSVLLELRHEQQIQKQLLEKYESVRVELKLMKDLARRMLVAQGKL